MNDTDQRRLSDDEYEQMEWLETKEDRDAITLDEKRELTALQMRWNNTKTETENA